MNAAAKLLNQRLFARHWITVSFFGRSQLTLSVFLFMTFMSAFSIIYMANLTRALHANLYQGKDEYAHLYAQQEQLILEKSTLAMQARVQKIAEKSLNMVVPDNQSVIMVQE